MSEFPLGYEKIDPTTWVYLSSLLMIGLYFKFSRYWSVRNLDLVLLVLLAPGLLFYHYGHEARIVASQRLTNQRAATEAADSSTPANSLPQATSRDASPPGSVEQPRVPEVAPPPDRVGQGEAAEVAPASDSVDESSLDVAATPAVDAAVDPIQLELVRSRTKEMIGFLWLFCVSGMFLLRMLLDPMMVRRPLLEPNLSTGGLTFIGCSLLVFLMANVINSVPTADDLHGPKSAELMMARQPSDENADSVARHGPGYRLIFMLPSLPTMRFVDSDDARPQTEQKQDAYAAIAKTVAILSHLAVVIGIVLIGYRHFDNLKMGIGAATLYLILPYTAQMTGRVTHVVPAALLVWAVLCYRRPLTTGMFMGLAVGVFYYPLFLLPLWLSFYWQRGLMRFTLGVLSMVAVTALSLVFISADVAEFWGNAQTMFGVWLPKMENLEGVWGLGWAPVYRYPVLAAFVALSGSFALWPAQKNLGTLLSCSGAVMLAAQFWHGYGGGLYMAWYLPLVLLTIFRPNLEDRVALSVLGEGWFPRRRMVNPTAVDRAA
jgi:hypothetical protein